MGTTFEYTDEKGDGFSIVLPRNTDSLFIETDIKDVYSLVWMPYDKAKILLEFLKETLGDK